MGGFFVCLLCLFFVFLLCFWGCFLLLLGFFGFFSLLLLLVLNKKYILFCVIYLLTDLFYFRVIEIFA